MNHPPVSADPASHPAPAPAPSAAPETAPETAQFLLDGHAVPCRPGQTLMQAAAAAGQHIPHLCWHSRLGQSGSCRLCVVEADGQLVAACTTPARPGQVVANRTQALDERRRLLLQMLFVEGNHFCPSCEKSGDCLLQATAAEMGMRGPRFEEFYPQRPVDASHDEVWLDLNRCILCKLCVRASHEVDGKGVFAIGGHGIGTHLIVNSPSGQLGDSRLEREDFATQVCPVGAILPKRRGFAVPIGQRRFDAGPPSAGAPVKAAAASQTSGEEPGHG
ncbi:MAG: (2Fe-2S)-binding protein [Rubrivivax sp.]|nr:(2Fe-2S)-binding protein [Rubrivivax sp.]